MIIKLDFSSSVPGSNVDWYGFMCSVGQFAVTVPLSDFREKMENKWVPANCYVRKV